jgi:hypothetical protein
VTIADLVPRLLQAGTAGPSGRVRAVAPPAARAAGARVRHVDRLRRPGQLRPFALVPLVLLGRRRDVMGDLADARGTTVAAGVASALVVVLNGLLLVRLVTG